MIREDSEIASLARKAWKRSARRIVELPSLPERLAYQRMQLRGSLQPHLAGVPEDNVTLGCSRCSFRRTPCLALRRMLANVALRTSIGSRRRSVPFSSSWSKAYRNACGSFRRVAEQVECSHSSASQHTTSPSIRQQRTLRWFTASTIA